jgi:hypothetical protein
MIFDPRYQPTRSNIMGLSTEYLRTPYKVGTAACADWEMEEAGERLVNGGSMPSARITSRNPGQDLRSRSCNKCLRLFRKPESYIAPLRAIMFHPLFVRITCGWRINDGMGTARRLIEPE